MTIWTMSETGTIDREVVTEIHSNQFLQITWLFQIVCYIAHNMDILNLHVTNYSKVICNMYIVTLFTVCHILKQIIL